MSRTEVRLIRKGGVVLFGRKWYRVSLNPKSQLNFIPPNPKAYAGDPPYTGQLDGLRGVFHHYGPSAASLLDSIFLVSCPPDDWPGKNCDEDGYFRWERWRDIPRP